MKPTVKQVLERLDMTRVELSNDGLIGAAIDVAYGMNAINRLLELLCDHAPHTFECEFMGEQTDKIKALNRKSDFAAMAKLRRLALDELVTQAPDLNMYDPPLSGHCRSK